MKRCPAIYFVIEPQDGYLTMRTTWSQYILIEFAVALKGDYLLQATKVALTKANQQPDTSLTPPASHSSTLLEASAAHSPQPDVQFASHNLSSSHPV